MMQALLVSNALLWIAVLALSLVVVALVRQIGVLHARIAPVGALDTGAGPRPGDAAPELLVDDWSGRRVRLGGAAEDGRSTLLFFLSSTCPVCKSLLPALGAIAEQERAWLRVVWASDGARAEHAALVAEHDLSSRAFVLSTPLALAYRVGQLPFAVLIDAAGIVRAAGLVNTREHLESLFEAQALGVPDLQTWLADRDRRRAAG
ncbi:MAG TPA: methylamine dehydrogenase accessory protein MauD [Myxococcota bacterium]|nr:methylamine dehydrogenase accessory protein MauD [Myxococcota bacterium]